MEKSDQLIGCTLERFRVYEPYTGAGSLLKLTANVGCGEGDMMDSSIGVLLQELGDRAFWIGGFEQFKVDFADAKERRAHLLGDDLLAMLALQSQRILIIWHSLIQRTDSDAQVVNFL